MARPSFGAQQQAVKDRETRIVQLRRQGLTWNEIAAECGLSAGGAAHTAWKRANARIIEDDVKETRQIEQERLDALQAANWSNAMNGDVPAGRLVLSIIDRRAKLLGLDMPIRVQQEVTVWSSGSDIDQEVQRLVQQLAASSGGTGVLAEPTSETGATTA